MYREYGFLIRLSIFIVCIALMLSMSRFIVNYFKESIELKTIELEYEFNERIDELEKKIFKEFYTGVYARNDNAQGGIEQNAEQEILRISGLSGLFGY